MHLQGMLHGLGKVGLVADSSEFADLSLRDLWELRNHDLGILSVLKGVGLLVIRTKICNLLDPRSFNQLQIFIFVSQLLES